MTEHLVSVKRLRELLEALRDDDILVPNQVANLSIIRDKKYVGYIDLLENQQRVELDEPPYELPFTPKEKRGT